MNIHEYQAKEIYRKYGIPVPMGIPAFSIDEAEDAAKRVIQETGDETVVVKAQIHAGGRGKGGGVKVVKGAEAVKDAAKKLLGQQLVTHQTGSDGKTVHRLLIEQGLAIEQELYLALVIDRERQRIAVMASTEGGVDIEEVAARNPEKIVTLHVDPAMGLMPYQARQIGFALGLKQDAFKELVKMLQNLGELFQQEDCSLVEINPLVVTRDNHVLALDAKINLDDNAAFRHKSWEDLRDRTEEEPTETDARAAGLSYIQLDGNIGCLVNGAGLAMATMDIVKHYGGQPANFLDVGGGANKDAVAKAFRIILESPSVKGIFVNIFGGIMKCDVLAEGVVAASKEVGLNVPLVVRLEGTNVEKGREILQSSGLSITAAATMAEGAQKVVQLVQG